MRIAGKTILVSGSSSGLGAACAMRFLNMGANVVGLDQSPIPKWFDDWVGPMDWKARYWHGQADVTSDTSVQRVVQEGKHRFGAISGAVCCAGVLFAQRVLGKEGVGSLEDFRKVIDVNLVGTYNVVRHVAKSISESACLGPQDPQAGHDQQVEQDQGVIVMTSSIAADEGQIGQCAYSASKGAIAAMTLPMARELARFGVRVVSIAPGVFDTPMMQSAPSKVRDPLLNATVYPKRFGLPDEFAAMVQSVFENSMVNAAVIRLDGALRM